MTTDNETNIEFRIDELGVLSPKPNFGGSTNCIALMSRNMLFRNDAAPNGGALSRS